jgi:hypothetical protein
LPKKPKGFVPKHNFSSATVIRNSSQKSATEKDKIEKIDKVAPLPNKSCTDFKITF